MVYSSANETGKAELLGLYNRALAGTQGPVFVPEDDDAGETDETTEGESRAVDTNLFLEKFAKERGNTEKRTMALLKNTGPKGVVKGGRFSKDKAKACNDSIKVKEIKESMQININV